jgi:N4-gp56 family major capsid protein
MAIRSYDFSVSGNARHQAMKEFLWTPNAHVYLDQVFQQQTIDRRSGAAVLFRRIVPMPIVATPSGVAEGVSPASQSFTSEDYTGTVTRYAEIYEVSRYNYDLSPFDEAGEGAKQLRIKVDRTRERIRYNAARAGSGVLYNSSSISSQATVNGVITLGRIQRAIAELRANRAEPYTEVDHGSTKVGSTPVEPCYLAFCSTDLEPDLRNVPGFTVTANTSGAKFKGEFGVVQNLRFITNADYVPVPDIGVAIGSTGFRSTTGTLIDVYPIIIAAKGSLSGVMLRGSSSTGMGNGKVSINDKPDKADPTNERVLMSADWYDLCLVTGNSYLRRIEVACTANPT